jgi:hypothetical protein
MIEQNISINVNENIDVIMNFIINHMDEYIRNGKIKSIRKVETHEISNLEDNKQKIKRFYFFAPILPDFINNIIGDSMDLFLTYNEEIIFNFEDNTSRTMIEQVNNFYNGNYYVKYNKIDEENTNIDITFNFELLLQSYSLFTFSTIMETIISQIFCSEMKNFYNNLGNDIKEFYKNKNSTKNDENNNDNNCIQNHILNKSNDLKIKTHKKNKTQKILS